MSARPAQGRSGLGAGIRRALRVGSRRQEPVAADLYIELLKRCLTREAFPDHSRVMEPLPEGMTADEAGLPARIEEVAFDPALRREGRDWPTGAETMVGRLRLDNLHHCVVDVIRRGVPGDLIETGVWRGGSTILMRGILAAYGVSDRTVWVADSFQGLPPPDLEKYPRDLADFSVWTQLAIPLEEVQDNFRRYGLLDDQVRFLPGWFRDTLPSAPIRRLAVLRLDGDMYESTMDALGALYDRVSPGGYVIVDDYAIDPCREAITDFREERGITDPIVEIDWTGVYWQKR